MFEKDGIELKMREIEISRMLYNATALYPAQDKLHFTQKVGRERRETEGSSRKHTCGGSEREWEEEGGVDGGVEEGDEKKKMRYKTSTFRG